MRHETVFLLLAATTLVVGFNEGRQGRNTDNPHCPFVVGVQMPPSGALELRFKPPYRKPLCFVDEGEATLDLKPATVRITTKPSASIVLRCREDAP